MAILSVDDHLDFLRRQVLTSRNVLFRSMPRPALRRCQPIVREFCRTHELPYRETGLIASYRQALRSVRAVGRAVGAPARISD
jgi:hypothetical protein